LKPGSGTRGDKYRKRLDSREKPSRVRAIRNIGEVVPHDHASLFLAVPPRDSHTRMQGEMQTPTEKTNDLVTREARQGRIQGLIAAAQEFRGLSRRGELEATQPARSQHQSSRNPDRPTATRSIPTHWGRGAPPRITSHGYVDFLEAPDTTHCPREVNVKSTAGSSWDLTDDDPETRAESQLKDQKTRYALSRRSGSTRQHSDDSLSVGGW